MAEENKVNFGANVSGLTQGMTQAATAVQQGVSQIQVKLGGLHEAFLKAFEFTTIYETLKTSFEKLVNVTLDYRENLERLAFATGGNAEEVQNLSNQLASVDITTDEYNGMLLKLERNLKMNEERMNAMGLVTKDAAGNHLQMNTIMANSINLLYEYKAGYDRNSVALEFFGRSAEKVVMMRRLDADAVERGTELTKLFGVVTADQINNSELMGRSVSQFGEAIHITSERIANQLLPYVSKLADQITQYLGKNIESTIYNVKAMITGIDYAFSAIYITFKTLEGLFLAIGEAIVKVARAAIAAGQGEFTEAGNIIKSIGTDSAEHWKKNITPAIAGTIDNWRARYKELWAEVDKNKPSAAKAADGGTRKAPASTSAKADADARFEALRKGLAAEAQLEIEHAKTLALEKLAIDQDAARRDYELGIITEEQKIALEGQFQQRSVAAESDAVAARMAILEEMIQVYKQHYGKGSVEFQKFNAQAIAELKRFEAELTKLGSRSRIAAVQTANAAEISALKPLQDLGNTVFSTLEQNMAGLLNGTQTWAQSWRNLLNMAGSEFARFVMQKVAAWAMGETMTTAATASGEAARLGIIQAAQQEGLLARLTAHAGTMLANAAEAFGGVFAWAAPYMGPFAAIPAAAAGAAVLAAQVVGLDVGAWDVPQDMYARIHKGETVVPKNFADGYRDSIAGKASGGGGGDTYVIKAFDGKDVARVLKRHGAAVVGGVKHEARNGNLAFRGMKQR